MARITEEQLILPALHLMNISPTKSITTTTMKEVLIDIFKPSGEDNEIISGRNDTFLSEDLKEAFETVYNNRDTSSKTCISI
jgi:hypothetical protein